MRIRRNSFKLRLTLSYIFIVFVSFGCAAFFLDRNLEDNLLQDIKSSLIKQAYLIESQITADNLKKEDVGYLENLARNLSPKIKSRVTIINYQGKVLADSEKAIGDIVNMENHSSRPEIEVALAGRTGIDTRYSSTLKINMLYAALPIKDKGEVIGVLRLAMPLTSVQRLLFTVRKTVFLGLLCALAFAIILGSLFTAWAINPINKIISASRRFAKGDFGRRIIVSSQDEIGELANTLNQMAQDIETKIREVSTQHQHLAAVFNSMIEGVIVVDSAGRVISINPTIERIFDCLKAEVEGKFFLEGLRNNDVAEVINRVLKRGEFVSQELCLSWPVQKVFQINASPIFEMKSVSGCLLVIHDITEMRKLETMRRDFVANVSHELKTPLTSIKGFVETLLSGALSDKENSRHFLEVIRNHTDRLSSLIDDLLDLSHIESKEIKLDDRKFHVKDLMDEVLFAFKSQVKKKGVDVENNISPDLLLKADKQKIEQVFTNLIDNAIKFNKQNGSINIYSVPLGDSLKIIVEDSGIGIPERDLGRIFERFYRVDKARSRELGGTGLGLAIVKHIIELHKGSVGVESVEGLGSKFWFSLPT